MCFVRGVLKQAKLLYFYIFVWLCRDIEAMIQDLKWLQHLYEMFQDCFCWISLYPNIFTGILFGFDSLKICVISFINLNMQIFWGQHQNKSSLKYWKIYAAFTPHRNYCNFDMTTHDILYLELFTPLDLDPELPHYQVPNESEVVRYYN